QFWNTLGKDSKTSVYSFQLDELLFNLNVDPLRKALGITPKDFAHPFVPPPADYCKKYLEMAARKPRQLITVIDEEGGKKKKSPEEGKSKQPKHVKRKPPSLLLQGKSAKERGKGKGKGIVSDKKVAQSLLDLQKPKKKSITDQYVFQRRTLATHDASTRPSTQPQDDTSANAVYHTLSLADSTNNAENVAAIEQSKSKADTEILNAEEVQGEEVLHTVALAKRNIEFDEGQDRSDPGKTLESRPLPERKFIEEDQAGSNPGQGHMAQVGPNPEPMHEDFIAIVYPAVHESLKLTTEEQLHIEKPLSSSKTLSSMKNLEDWVYKLENHDLYLKIDKQVNKVIKEVIHNALQALLCERFKDLSEFQMMEILHDRMFESGSYKSHPDHKTLYEALEVSMQRENNDELHEALTTSRKRRRDDQDPPPPPPMDLTEARRKSRILMLLLQNSLKSRKSKDTGVVHLPKIKTRPDWLKPLLEEEASETPESDWVTPPNDLPETENNWADALAKTYKDLEENKLLRKIRDMGSFIKWYCKQIGKKKLIKADFEDQAYKIVDLMNREGNQVVHDVSKPLPLGGPPDFGLKELVLSLWNESKTAYCISSAYSISYWWSKRKEFYITRHNAPSERNAVRSHMRILSVVSLKTFFIYGYTFLKEIILRRANYKEYKISEADFKNLYSNDFEDMYLLHLQVKLNQLSGVNKVHLSTTVNLWTRT
nr:hypothetical protein [Tanacetum cinerariifolium]